VTGNFDICVYLSHSNELISSERAVETKLSTPPPRCPASLRPDSCAFLRVRGRPPATAAPKHAYNLSLISKESRTCLLPGR